MERGRRLETAHARARWRRAIRVAALIALAGCNQIEVARPRDGAPNVLLITIDTLRADHVGPRGERTSLTPALDQLAASGTSFTNAIATVPTTLPSHTSILTGVYPPAHGVRHNGVHKLAPDAETVAQRFQAVGYATGAFVAAAVLDGMFGLDRGFDVYDDHMSRRSAVSGGTYELPGNEVSDKAIAWLAQIDRPFFAWVHYYDPHFTYSPPEPFASRHAGDPYSGEIAFVDAQVGRLLDALRGSKRFENTVVLITSDHGESLGEHGEGTHSYLVYEGVTHVPFILAGPGVPAGVRVDEVVSNAGAAQTLLARAGLAPLPRAQVGDLLQLARSESGGAGWAYSEALAGQLDHGWAPLHAIRTARFRFIEAPRPELYALDVDPREQRNLLPTQDPAQLERVAEARRQISDLMSEAKASVAAPLDAETRAQIEALGYVVPRAAEASESANAPDPKDVVQYAELELASTGLLSLGRLEEAEQVARLGLAKLPNSIVLAQNLWRIHALRGRSAEALAVAEAAAQRAPSNPSAQALLGEARRVNGDLRGAVAAFERARALDPALPEAHFALFVKRAIGAPIEELEALARAGLDAGGRSTRAYEACGRAWESVREYERALDCFQSGLEDGQGDESRLHMLLAIHAARLGDDELLAAHAAQAGPAARDLDLARELGIAFAARGQSERAEAIFRFLAVRDLSGGAQRMLEKLERERRQRSRG